ncbi:MAG: phosphatase PAP2 family protein [Proteobacteria bacterium]|nr:phosphatase PAP2 family protein [Pseudomonadota bacterium]
MNPARPAEGSQRRTPMAAAALRQDASPRDAPDAVPPSAPAALTWRERELAWLLVLHRTAERRGVEAFFVIVSRLGDGLGWIFVVLLLPLVSTSGLACALRMAGVGLVNVVVYVALKRSVARPRPFIAHEHVRECTPALDRYSFPSGHTMHAVAFTVVLAEYFPIAAALAATYALLVSASRLVLGLHYPSDVVIGAAIGAITASAMFSLF